MDTAEKIRLVTRPPTSEVVTTEDLDALFASNQRPKHYIGLEISGFLHLGSLVSTGYKINDFADAGMDCTVFLADWHTMINDKISGDMEKISLISKRTYVVKIALLGTLAVLVFSLPLLAFANGPELVSGSYTINSAGATFPYPLIDLWRVEIAKETSENLQLNYQSIGSGGGVQQHIAKTVNFAATDAPLKISEAKLTPGTLHIPETIGGVVVAYNIPEIPNSGLKLDGDTLAKIYLGEITKWNDESIAKNNPDQNLPDEKIVPVRRSDGSGTTFVFTDYLTAVSSEFDVAVGKGKSVQWPARTHGAAGNEGVAGIIRSTEYTIGYVELAYAFQTGMSYAYVQNGDGTAFVEPTLDSISAASQNVAQALPEPSGDWSEVSLVNTPGDNSYPIASFTYLLVYDEISKTTKSKEQAQALIYMIYWMLTSGQSFSPDLLYVPIPDAVADIGKDALSQITYEGETLWNYNPTPEVKLPDWFRTIAQFWIDGKISDSEYINNLQYLISNGILQVD